MLFLIFKLGGDRYALDARCILEVIPLVDMKHLAHSAAGVAGILDYRGAAIPVIDLSVLVLGRPAMNRISTRIVIVEYDRQAQTRTHLLGLIAEGATESMRRGLADFADFGIANGSASYLGPVTRGARGLIQRIDVNKLLSEPIRTLLFDAAVPH